MTDFTIGRSPAFRGPPALHPALIVSRHHQRRAGRGPGPRLALSALLLCATAIPAAAQETIVVTGRGLDPPSGERVYDVAVIPRERLTGTASGRLEDALLDVAGVAQFRRSDSRSAHPTSQGVTLRGLGGNAASRALVTLDGVPQADPFGGWVAFPAFLPERLASVRVTRGGGSGFQGPGALAGTIALDSGGADDLAPLSGRIVYGSRDSVDAAAVAAVRLGNGFATLAGQFARGDGFMPVVADDRGPVDRPAPYRQASLSVRTVFDVGDATELQANLSGYADKRDRGVDFTDNDSKGADASVRLVGRGGWGWSALAYLQARQFASGFASVGPGRATVNPALHQYNVPSTGLGARVELAPPIGGGAALRLGGDLRHVEGRTQEQYIFSGTTPSRRRVAGGTNLTAGGFAQLSLETGRWTLDASGRLDRWWIRDGSRVERNLAGGPAVADIAYADRSGWEPTGRLGMAYALGETLSVRAAAYRGWRLPTLNELYRPYRVGSQTTTANAGLSPERLNGVEAGMDWGAGARIGIGATLFWNRLEDAIANVTDLGNPDLRQRQNVDAVESRGVEVDARWRAGAFSVVASYAYVDARVDASGTAFRLDGLRPAQTAKHRASATLGWTGTAFRASATGRYVGPQYDGDLNDDRLSDAFTVDAVAGMRIGKGLELELRGENLFDALVEAGIGSDGSLERATPRTLWVGLGYRLR